jgi:hypothetical protein
MMASCAIPGCGQGIRARGWCNTHYRRWQRHGDPGADIPVAPKSSDGSSYLCVRRRLQRERGSATATSCAECGVPAAFWSYAGGDPDERIDPARGVRFSLDLSRYRPRCRACHRRVAPRRGGPRVDGERVVRLYRAGASSTGIASLLGVTPSAVLAVLHAAGEPLRAPGRPRRAPGPQHRIPTRHDHPNPHFQRT